VTAEFRIADGVPSRLHHGVFDRLLIPQTRRGAVDTRHSCGQQRVN
jgi:hypothetical protein